MSGTAEITAAPTSGSEASPSRRRMPTWLVVVLVAGLVVGTAVVASARTSAARFAEQASVFTDIAVTKTFDELSRQSYLPPEQRDVAMLEAALATPQSDKGSTIWTTDVRQFDRQGDAIVAQVVVTATTATGEPLYLFEFVERVTPPRSPGSTPEVSVCAVSTTPDGTRSTGEVFYTDHMVMPSCADSAVLWLGPGT